MQPGSVSPCASGLSPASLHDIQRTPALVLMVASGFAGLGYQIIWTQQASLWLGHEAAAVLAVIAAFFGGLAVGALLLGKRIERSTKPVRWYAACEVAIGLWSVALVVLMPWVTGWLLNVIGAQPSPAWQWLVSFGGTFVMLLPATAAMGATMPAMERVLRPTRGRRCDIATLYAGNTLGAVAGVLATAFWLVPTYGLMRSAIACALLNGLCGAIALTMLAQSPQRHSSARRNRSGGVLTLLAVTGMLGIGYEVVVARVLSQVAENTVYTLAIVLAVYLAGTTLGAAVYSRWLFNVTHPQRLRDQLLFALAAACVVGVLSLLVAPSIKDGVLHLLGRSMASALMAEAMLATVAFLLPTVIMGALFSHLCSVAREDGVGFGCALGINTLGAGIAPFLFGMLLTPWMGTKIALLLIAAGYLALSSRRAWSTTTQWLSAAGILMLAVWTPSLAIIDVPDGGRIIRYEEGALATVSVVEDRNGSASLHINNRQQEGSSTTIVADARQALLPILLHSSPRRVLFLGLGTGVTAYSAAEDATLDIDVVELLPEVIAASDHFTRELAGNAASARLRIVAADARRFVRATDERYDVVVSDNFHPARSGTAALYTVEHFSAVRDRLAADGLFCQWLPLHQLDLATLRSIVQSFLAVYPRGLAMLASNSLETPVLGLIAQNGTPGFDREQVRDRLSRNTMRRAAEFGITDELALLGSFIAGPGSLARFAGDAPLNTDDHPRVAYAAPRITYSPDSEPRDRLIALLQQVELQPEDVLAPSQADSSRLVAYWTARDRFIRAGRDVRPTSDLGTMLQQVRDPLLAVLRISPDFRPAYDPLLRMAVALAPIDAAAARKLLTELTLAQPARPEAALVLRDLGARSR